MGPRRRIPRCTGLVPPAVVVVAWLGFGAGPARAAEETRVVSGFEQGRRFDLNLSVWWIHDQKQAFIKRELQSAATPNETELVRDLISRQTRDTLNLRMDVGVLPDVGFHVDLPLVVRDDRQLDFDQSAGDACVFPGAASRPTCVNQDNATILRDGILPGAGQTSYGVDATHGGASFSNGSATVFRGPRRSGLEALGLGVAWAIFNQKRDETKPTWLMGVDMRFNLGTTMRYDAANPGGNTGVGLGYHQAIFTTAMSKQIGIMDPYVRFFYSHPLVSDSSPFAAYPIGGQPYSGPQKMIGASTGFEVLAIDRPDLAQRVTLEARVHGEHRFQGRSFTEIWEPLSGSSACPATPTACRAGLDTTDLNNDGKVDPFPGLTETQAYSSLGADLGLNIQIGRYVRFRGLFGVTSDLPHFITFGTAGRDVTGPAGVPDGRVDSTIKEEANPVYRETIDIPGRRFRVDGSQVWRLLLDAGVLF